MTEITVPTGFVLGTATSAYQIEGAAHLDGKGSSIWDTFTNTPGKTAGDVPGDRGADHVRRFEEDVRHMVELGIDDYRFSLSWTRLLPDGIGRVNEAGVAFYDRLIDTLVAAGIRPHVTLYHWDLPQHLQDLGGWPNRDVVDWFGEYAALAFARFGDRVSMWSTMNEPISTWVGYGLGIFAPGLTDPRLGKQAMHHAMLAHGRAVQEFRRSGFAGEIGIVIDIWKRHPATDSAADLALAQRDEDDGFRFFFDELFAGGWNPRLAARLEEEGTTPTTEPGDAALAAEPIDFLGINVYSRVVVSADNYNPQWWTTDDGQRLPGGNYLENGQEFYPRALPEAVRMVREEYGVTLPIIITENGYSNGAEVVQDGTVHDADRIRYLSAFLQEAIDAAEELDIRGFYAWSLIDNYEWSAAYTERYGLIRVDFDTMERTWKDSARWYQQVCRDRVLHAVESTAPVESGPQ